MKVASPHFVGGNVLTNPMLGRESSASARARCGPRGECAGRYAETAIVTSRNRKIFGAFSKASLPVDGPASSPLGSAPVYLSGTGSRHPPAYGGTVAAMLGALRRRWLIAGAVVLVLVALAAGILVAYRLHQERNIKGSSTVEFTTTTPPKKPVSPPKPQGVVWPLWGYDPPHTRAPEGIKLLPPYRTIWTFNARQLLEFPPAIAYGRLYINSYDGVFYALNEKTGKRAVALRLEPLRRLVGRRRRTASSTRRSSAGRPATS